MKNKNNEGLVKFNKKEVVYVINQPNHSLLSIVVVDDKTDFPLSENIHNNIEKLREISDIIFLFSNNSKNINRKKFTSLYRACGYIESDRNINETLLKLLYYSLEIFGSKIVGNIIVNISDLEEFSDKLRDNIIKINMSPVMKPIFKIRRLSSKEYYDIYKIKTDNISNGMTLTSYFLEYTTGINIINQFKSNKIDNIGMYSSFTSDSKILYFKTPVIKLIISFWKGEENSRENYTKSFKNNDVRYFLSSVVKYLGIEVMDLEIENLNIENISYGQI